jgi:hypothetical protein
MLIESALILALQIAGGIRAEMDRFPPQEFCRQMKNACKDRSRHLPFGSDECCELRHYEQFWENIEYAHWCVRNRSKAQYAQEYLEKARLAVGDDAYYYSPPTHTWGRE